MTLGGVPGHERGQHRDGLGSPEGAERATRWGLPQSAHCFGAS